MPQEFQDLSIDYRIGSPSLGRIDHRPVRSSVSNSYEGVTDHQVGRKYLVGTITTRTCRIIHYVTSAFANSEELVHVLPTSLSRWRIEVIQLRCSAYNGPIVQLCDDHATNKARKRIELKEPGAPECRYLWVWNGDAAEEGECDNQERIEKGADDCDCVRLIH